MTDTHSANPASNQTGGEDAHDALRAQHALDRLAELHPKLIDLGLDRTFALLNRLGNPHHALPPTIHVSGTNGKGSTQAMIRAGLESEGHAVHAYTSPHLARFHERIRLAGDLIEEDALSELLEHCETVNDGQQITYFEIINII